MIEITLIRLLEKDSILTQLVGRRIFPQRVPQAEDYPAITYQIISNNPTNTLYGVSGMDKVRVQINTFARTYSDLKAINATIRRVLDGYRSTELSGIAHIYFDSERDLYAEDALLYQNATDYFIQLRR